MALRIYTHKNTHRHRHKHTHTTIQAHRHTHTHMQNTYPETHRHSNAQEQFPDQCTTFFKTGTGIAVFKAQTSVWYSQPVCVVLWCAGLSSTLLETLVHWVPDNAHKWLNHAKNKFASNQFRFWPHRIQRQIESLICKGTWSELH